MSGLDEKRFDEEALSFRDFKEPFDANAALDHHCTSEDKAILRIFDYRIIPVLWVMYLVSSADRANVGLALTMNPETNHGLQATANLAPQQVSLGIALFYVGYTFFEIPSNLVITKVNPGLWLARICVTWGIVTSLYALVNDAASFFVLRLLLGIAEAGLFPGMAYYLTKWYRKSEISTRIAIYYFAGPTSTIITAFISIYLQTIDGAGNLYAWKWLFIIFGVSTVIVGLFTLFWLPADPAQSNWLTDDQKIRAVKRLQSESHNDGHWKLSDLIDQFKDYKVYLFGILYLSPVAVSTSLQYAVPTVILELLISTYGAKSVTGITVSLLLIPPSFMIVISAVLITMLSDRFNQRALTYIFFQLISIAGFIMLTFGGSLSIRYSGILVIGFGLGPLVPLAIGWTTNSKDGSVSIAAATAIVSSIAQFGVITVTYALYTGWPSDAPHYIGSNMVNVGLCAMGIIASIILKLDFIRLNKQIEQHGQTASGRKVKYIH